MKSNIWNLPRMMPGVILGLALMAGVTNAQSTPVASKSPEPDKSADSKKSATATDAKKATKPNKSTETTPTSATAGEDAGNFKVTSSIELGYRGIRVDGDVNKYKSDLNYKAGPRLFDTSFLMQAKDGTKEWFDSLLVTSSGFGADPSGHLRINVENPKWYRFEGSYRRFKYYRVLNTIANPNWLFTGFPVPPNPVTGLHGYNTSTQLGDFDLTLLPKNEKIRFNVGYAPERYSGPYFSNYHIGGNEFQLFTNARSRANDFRVGADGKLGPVDWTFLQGFRRFRDDSFVDTAPAYINPNPAVARLTTYNRNEPTRGSIDYTRFSLHTLVARKLDITGRIVYSKATSNSTFLENMTGTNFNTRIGSGATAQPGSPNVLILGKYNIPSSVKRPNTIADIGATFLATDKFRISNTFRVEDFTIDGVATFNDFFSVSRGTTVDTRTFVNLPANKVTKYRKYQNTVEGDYQFNPRYSVHFGYRYASRREEQILTGYALSSNAPTLLVPEEEIETNHTNAFFAGFKARPVNNWTLYFDAEHGTADNVFTRIGNYNYTNIRAKSRYAPNRKMSFNLAVITKDNSNPSEIAGVLLNDFGVNVKSRTFTSAIDWNPNSRVLISTGYNYTWVNSDAVVDYYYQTGTPLVSGFHHGNSLYFQRNNFFYLDLTARLFPRVTLYSSYRINQDNGQGNLLANPAGGTVITPIVGTTPAVYQGGTLVNSYPMNFQSPEARLAIRLSRYIDWNLGYQYYNYHESVLVGPRPQNYHAHLPYMSLRVYIGRGE